MAGSRTFSRIRRRIAVATALVLLTALPSPAVFHFAVIDEVMTSYDGDPEVQFVEIRMLAILQHIVSNSVLGAFDASGNFLGDVFIVPSNVVRNGPGVRWIMGTSAFQTASGLSPDFIIPPSLPLDGGMICWGAPGTIAPNPTTWDHSIPSNYVDCLAYGTYSGPTNVRIGTATPLLPEGHSLQRLTNTFNNLADFSCGDPATPTNNAAATISLAATVACFQPGDLNHDMQVDAEDLPGLLAAIFLEEPPSEADVNEDDRAGAADIVALVKIAAAS